MRRMLCVLIITALVLVGTVVATPVLPGEFYGSVFLNGNPAPAGTVIVAKINGEPRGELTTTVAGQYGGPDNFDPRLIVTSTEEEVTAGNVSVTFFVGGVQAFQIFPFRSGNSEKLDLLANSKAFETATTTVIPSYSSSGGSSGGGGGGGYVAASSGTGTGSSPVIPVKSTSVITPSTTGTVSTISANINAPKNATVTTVIATTATTPAPGVTTIPTTKKAGVGPLSLMFLVPSIIAILCIVGRASDTRKRR